MLMSIDEIHATLTAPGQWFETDDEVIRGVPTRVWKNAPPSLPAVLQASRAHGEQTFLVYEGEHTTFDGHFRRAATLAHRFIEHYGIGKGDRVAIAMRNFPEWPIAFWAASAAGAIAVPLNSWGTGTELAYALSDSGAKLLVADVPRIERLREHLPALGLRGVIAARAESQIAGCDDFGAVLGEVATDVELPEVEISPEDDATIFYTSGTTGRPKGAVGTHRNICSNAVSLAFVQLRGLLRSGAELPDPSAPREQQTALVSVPFFHVTGCHGVMLGMTAFGGKMVLMYKWDPERALELIEQERVTSLGGVPAMILQLLESPAFSEHDVSSVRSIGYGGAPAPPELLRKIEKHFPAVVPSNGYGLTETSSMVTVNAGSDYARAPDSVGPALPICDLKVVDAEQSEVPAGELGELWIRGANVVRGYWNRPEATADEFSDGWFHTSDLVRVDAEGFVYIVDRLKDMVIRGGENVYCAEVENALFEHPAVLDAAVVGVPHPILGEEVGAFVQRRPATPLSEQELADHLAARLATFKIPTKLRIQSEPLPRNPAGKVLKRELRARFAPSSSTGQEP